jgi:thiol-disulfide isomerase/thioredoxin
LLAQEVVRKYGNRAHFVVQDLGASPLADRLGIDKYPAIFVDDALVARPEDFYAWGGPPVGKYLPWNQLASRRRFQADLQRMMDIRLEGGTVPSLAGGRTVMADRFLPGGTLVDLQGKKFNFAQLQGKPVLVEFWATWCPFCLETLSWMKELDPASANIVAVVVDSDRKDVDALVRKLHPPGLLAFGSAALRREFDGPPALPTLLLADASGRIVHVYYGAPQNLHQQIVEDLRNLATRPVKVAGRRRSRAAL